AKVALRNFILSKNFLALHTIFNQLLSIWADTLMSLVEATGTPFPNENQIISHDRFLITTEFFIWIKCLIKNHKTIFKVSLIIKRSFELFI
ncbi:MAG: hypothetical protein ACFFD1_08595, partial [Candidatus Thorarchaeota archaeon]